MENKKQLSLSHLTLGGKYLSLSENALQEMINHGNPHAVVMDEENMWDEYFKKTKWSDFNIIFPTLFLFYHGLELTMKGLVSLHDSKIPTNHKVDLLNKVKNLNELDAKIIEILEKYLDIDLLKNSPLSDWITTNNLSIDNLYERLRYPTNKGLTGVTNDWPLKYKEDAMIPFAEGIVKDSRELRSLSVAQFRKIYPSDPTA